MRPRIVLQVITLMVQALFFFLAQLFGNNVFLLPFSNSVIMDVLLSQRCGKILVGDPHQQIYTFRGAVNALNIVDHTHIYYLTQVNANHPHIHTLEHIHK